MAETLAIEPRSGRRGKTWKVECLGLITADRYWSAPSGKAYRPVYLCVAQREDVLRGFIAHFEAGRPATLRNKHGHEEPYEVETHAALRWTEPQRTGAGASVATAWLPKLCELDASRMPDRLRFLFAPGQAWIAEQLATPPVQALPADVRVDAVVGGLFAAFAGARTPWPIVPDPLFHARLWRAVQGQERWCVTSAGTPRQPGPMWSYPGAAPAGVGVAMIFDANHHEFQALLGEETRRYFEAEGAGRLATANTFEPKEKPWSAKAKTATANGTSAGTAAGQVRPKTRMAASPPPDICAEETAAGPAPVGTSKREEEPLDPSRETEHRQPLPAAAGWQPSLFD